jgi:TatD DNase family protein
VFDDDRAQVLERATKNGISDIVIPGTERCYWDRIKNLCSQSHRLHACYGLHPYWANRHQLEDVMALQAYIEKNRPVAIGECGLDFRKHLLSETDSKSRQLAFFEAQLGLAEVYQLPVVIHSVRATEAVIQSIQKFKGLRGMIHSYSGSLEQARQLIDLGFYISLGGSVTYENASKLRKVAQSIPLSSMLLETDAPDQPDKQHSAQRNEPAFIRNTLEEVASLREEPVEDIAKQTSANTRKLFAI